MTRTVRVRGAAQVPWRLQPTACGFCSILLAGGRVDHHLCPGVVKDGRGRGSDWTCPCHAAGHPVAGNPQPQAATLDPVE